MIPESLWYARWRRLSLAADLAATGALVGVLAFLPLYRQGVAWPLALCALAWFLLACPVSHFLQGVRDAAGKRLALALAEQSCRETLADSAVAAVVRAADAAVGPVECPPWRVPVLRLDEWDALCRAVGKWREGGSR